MNRQQFHPAPVLQPYIREYMIITTDEATDSLVIPDTSLVMSLRYRGAIGSFSPILISGLRRSARLIPYSAHTANFLILFREGGLAAFSRMSAHELFSQTITADNLFPPAGLRELLERIAEAGDDNERVTLAETFLFRHLLRPKQDLLIGNAVQQIRQHQGLIRIDELASSLCLSQDPFEKRFRAIVGSTPKQYASIIRLRNLIRNYPTYSSLTEASYDAGYFDQSHFIKDFRNFTGRAPKEFFQSSLFW